MPSNIKDNNTIIPLKHKLRKDLDNFLDLETYSPRDKPWNKHKVNSEVNANHYRDSEFDNYANRIDQCSQELDFKLVPEPEKGNYKLKLASAHFCRVKFCSICQWRKSLMWKAKAYRIMPLVLEKYPKHRWLFVTLTVKNCPITELRNELFEMNDAWHKFSQRKAFPAIGWIRSTEVTKSVDDSAHPHFHCLLLVQPSYFGDKYVKQADWTELWKKSLRIDYTPIVDVRAIKAYEKPESIIPEMLKYTVKESDLIRDDNWFLELTRQMYRMRTIATGGVLKEYLKELEQEPEDLIGKGDEDDKEVDEGHLYFSWKKPDKKYKLIN